MNKRIIEYRAWIPKLKQFFLWGVGDVEGNGAIMTAPPSDASATSQQYIYRKDKSGKKIYEGDFVLLSAYPWLKVNSKRPALVEWSDEKCGFEPFCTLIEEYGYPPADEWAEVVGNIFENPELIKRRY